MKRLPLALALALCAGAAAAQTPVLAPEPLSPQVTAAIDDFKAGRKDQALRRLEAAEQADDVNARVLLGEVFQNGIWGVVRDVPRACGYFEKAKEVHGEAAHNYALCMEKGLTGAPADPAKARGWYAKGAMLGFSKSSCALGNLMIRGQGGPADIPNGLALCRDAATSGERDAQAYVGALYLQGQYVARDMAEARNWYAKAAAQGQPGAAFILGQIYWNGDGVPKNPGEAVKLWQIAYKNGRADASVLLGNAAAARAVETARAGAVDQAAADEAIRWYDIALKTQLSAAAKADVTRRLEAVKQLKAAPPPQ